MKNSQQSGSLSKWIFVAIGVLVIIGIYLGSNRGYGKVSDRSYKVATALYGVCLSQNEERLEKVSLLLVDTADGEDSIPSHERAWLTSIVQTARNGNWESAAKASKRMMEDQVVY